MTAATDTAASTEGIRIAGGPARWRAFVELASSMRFAISLLSVICIASVIGTVLKQQEPAVNYVNQFGPFWAEVFTALGLDRVYSAPWFLLILAFLVVSTSLCIARNAPKIATDLRAYKENLREQSLKAFHHRAEASVDGSPAAAAARIGGALAAGGWKVRLQERPHESAGSVTGGGWMVAAKTGAANKLGYLAAHGSIVLICLGGLADGDLIVRAQMALTGKTPFAGSGSIAAIAPQHRLGTGNPTFRGNLMVSEGGRAGAAVLNQSGGVVIQDLPFSVELKKFIVEYYSTGMPKLFASEIVIHDNGTGEAVPARVEVNKPAHWRGVDIYQSSFDDGGSRVKLKAVPMRPAGRPFEVEGVIGGSTVLEGRGNVAATDGRQALTLEYTGLRVINVENFGADPSGAGGVDVRKVDLRDAIDSRLGAANKTQTDKRLRNVGPSVSYKLRDGAGQAREFNNYMLPVDLGDGVPVFLLGARDSPNDAFRYLRMPADSGGGMDAFVQLRAALADGDSRGEAVRRYAAKAVEGGKPELAAQLAQSAGRALDLFAGVGVPAASGEAMPARGGLQAISAFLESNVPEAERGRASEVLVRILNGSLAELMSLARESAGAGPAWADEEKGRAFLAQAVLALSDAQLYPAPMTFALTDFTQVQASVFQVARAPGRYAVYLGCALLILGIFAMLYIRERRVWVWLAPAEGGASRATMALSSNRQTLDTDREFDRLKATLLGGPT